MESGALGCCCLFLVALVDPSRKCIRLYHGLEAFQRLQSSGVSKKGNFFGMTEEQQKKIEKLRIRMRMEEEEVEREMERQQVAMANSKIVELAKLSGRATWKKNNNGEDHDEMVQLAMKDVFRGFERIMKAFDCARLKTLKRVWTFFNQYSVFTS